VNREIPEDHQFNTQQFMTTFIKKNLDIKEIDRIDIKNTYT